MSYSNRQSPLSSVSATGTPVLPHFQPKFDVLAPGQSLLRVTVQFGQENVKYLYFSVPGEVSWKTFTEIHLGIPWQDYIEDHAFFHGWYSPLDVFDIASQPEEIAYLYPNGPIPSPDDLVNPEAVIDALLDRYSSLWVKDRSKPRISIEEVFTTEGHRGGAK